MFFLNYYYLRWLGFVFKIMTQLFEYERQQKYKPSQEQIHIWCIPEVIFSAVKMSHPEVCFTCVDTPCTVFDKVSLHSVENVHLLVLRLLMSHTWKHNDCTV